MAERGHGLQVVQETKNHTFELNEPELEKLLLNGEIKDLPVVVVSVVGAVKQGKSFFLNFLLKYLKSPQSARDNGSWLSEKSEPLEGFEWTNSSKSTTRGIILWSEPFLATLSDGNKVAVLLMDTQGILGNDSNLRDCSFIFSLSALLSSVQIYNLSLDINERDFNNLDTFTALGIKEISADKKAFQTLLFLVRDWMYPDEYPYGAVGGKQFLEYKFQITPNSSRENVLLRRNISSHYENLTCFLMPHPGFEILQSDYSGQIADIEAEFRMQIIDFMKSLFVPEKLIPKKINGQQIKACDMLTYFKTYVNSFKRDSPGSLVECNVTGQTLQNGAEGEFSPEKPCVPGVISVHRSTYQTK